MKGRCVIEMKKGYLKDLLFAAKSLTYFGRYVDNSIAIYYDHTEIGVSVDTETVKVQADNKVVFNAKYDWLKEKKLKVKKYKSGEWERYLLDICDKMKKYHYAKVGKVVEAVKELADVKLRYAEYASIANDTIRIYKTKTTSERFLVATFDGKKERRVFDYDSTKDKVTHYEPDNYWEAICLSKAVLSCPPEVGSNWPEWQRILAESPRQAPKAVIDTDRIFAGVNYVLDELGLERKIPSYQKNETRIRRYEDDYLYIQEERKWKYCDGEGVNTKNVRWQYEVSIRFPDDGEVTVFCWDNIHFEALECRKGRWIDYLDNLVRKISTEEVYASQTNKRSAKRFTPIDDSELFG